MTAQPKPTAADVLREHYAVDRQPFGRPAYRQCTCGWAEDVNRRGFPQHQADMLAAAGLLATAEHDARVLRAWAESLLDRYPEDVFTPPSRDAYDRLHRARGATGVSLDALSADAMRRAARLAIQDADRIAGGST